MVVFNCNACGEALKKNQVEKHTLRCRYCEALSCVDCGKDFWGNDYQTHTKCMTENEKYCGKNYVPKVNKGEAKQEQWIEKVQSAIDKSVSNPKLKGLLERLKDYPNIPRKKIKFVNFLKNSLRFHNETLINHVWDTLMAANTQETDKQNGDEATKQTVNGSATDICDADSGKKENGQERADKKEKKSKNESTGIISEKGKKHKLSDKESKDALQDKEEDNVDGESNTAEHKLSKRERKEERRKKANKKEKKDKNDNSDKEETGNDRNGKKRKHSENDEIPEETEVAEEIKKKKKQASELKDCDDALPKNGECTGNTDNESNDKSDEEITEPKKKKSKKVRFNWEATILEVLKSKGEMSLKKLQKKVLNEFAALDAANYAEDNLRAKFDKKVKKIAQVKVFKDRVKLK